MNKQDQKQTCNGASHSFSGDSPRQMHQRRKRHLAWEQAELASGGLYARNLEEIAHRFPQLTPMELRVTALVKAMLPSWRIGEILCISEKAVENYRVKIRRKIGCNDERLDVHLQRCDGKTNLMGF